VGTGDARAAAAASIGAYALNRSIVDLAILYVAGAVSMAMRAARVPLVPAVLGLILGPMAELQWRRAMAISEGDATVFVTRPLSAVLLAAAVLIVFASAFAARRAGAAPSREADA
jgi:putative tricarboxylic transport membrane protein